MLKKRCNNNKCKDYDRLKKEFDKVVKENQKLTNELADTRNDLKNATYKLQILQAKDEHRREKVQVVSQFIYSKTRM